MQAGLRFCSVIAHPISGLLPTLPICAEFARRSEIGDAPSQGGGSQIDYQRAEYRIQRLVPAFDKGLGGAPVDGDGFGIAPGRNDVGFAGGFFSQEKFHFQDGLGRARVAEIAVKRVDHAFQDMGRFQLARCIDDVPEDL